VTRLAELSVDEPLRRRHTTALSVDELLQRRHKTAAAADVESPSRAAGGFPTLGGGMRVSARADMAALVDAAGFGIPSTGALEPRERDV
jgi:hypothetical protein